MKLRDEAASKDQEPRSPIIVKALCQFRTAYPSIYESNELLSPRVPVTWVTAAEQRILVHTEAQVKQMGA